MDANAARRRSISAPAPPPLIPLSALGPAWQHMPAQTYQWMGQPQAPPPPMYGVPMIFNALPGMYTMPGQFQSYNAFAPPGVPRPQ